MPGFEPGNGGIKIRCLTTWLLPTNTVGKTVAPATLERHHSQSFTLRQWRAAMRIMGLASLASGRTLRFQGAGITASRTGPKFAADKRLRYVISVAITPSLGV